MKKYHARHRCGRHRDDPWKGIDTEIDCFVCLKHALNAERQRARTATQFVVETIGATGPEDLESALGRLVAQLDAEREKVKGLESEGVKLFEWRLALHSLTPGGSEFCTPDACEQWVRKIRTSQHEYIIEQIKQRKGLQTELTQLQELVRALPVVSEVTSDTVVNLVQQYSFHAWILRALQLRATLDATTPAGGRQE